MNQLETVVARFRDFMDSTSSYYLELTEEVIEIVIGVPTFILAVYSTYKLRLLITFPPTTRIVLGASTSAIALMTLIHPITNWIPREVYSVERGHYYCALLVYSLQFVCLACTLLLDTKFMLMGYESYLAFKNRSDYEYRDGSQGWILVAYYVGFAFVVSWAKILWYVFYKTDMALDVRLHYAFFIEDSMEFVSFQYFIAFVALIYGYSQIYRIHRFASSMKYECRSLTESFQVKQIVTLLGILKPLALSFTIGYILALSCHLCGVVMLLKGYTKLYKNLTAGVFAIGGGYNTFALLYMIFYLPALRQLMIRDIIHLFRLSNNHRFTNSTRQPSIVDRIEKPEDHFQHLKEMWNK